MAQMTAKGIWERLPIGGDQSGGGVWQQVDTQLAAPQPISPTPRLSIWEVLQAQPGGLWGYLGEETVVHEPTLDGVWSEALDETLILGGDSPDIWGGFGDDLLEDPNTTGLWQELGEETIILTQPEQSLWEQVAGKPGFEDMQPQRQLGYALKRFVTAQGEVYYVLKNLRQGTYLRLNERQYFLWNIMDGENAIQDIAVAYMAEYGSLDVGLLIDLLSKLEAGYFLTTQQTNVYDQLEEKISGRGLGYWLKEIGKFFMQKEFPLPRMDEFYTKTYNGGIKYFYAKPVQIVFLIVSVLGMGAFGYLLLSGEYSVLSGATASLSLGLIALYVGRTVALFIHEGGHAYTCKHYGRTIRKSGVMTYYGTFAFYVDSTDIWMESRFPRIMVSFGGPYTGFIMGGAAALFILASPWEVVNGWAYQFAFLIVLDSVFNLNPLLKWDGYYILMDILEMPNLRTRALNFINSGKMFKKLFKRESFNREERIFSIYGVLTFVYTATMLGSFFIFFGSSILNFIANNLWVIPLGILAILYMYRKKIVKLFSALPRRLARRAR